MQHNILHRFLIRWAWVVSHHPLWVLAVTFGLAIASVIFTFNSLTFNPNRNDLISPKLDWNQRFIAWQSRFPGSSDVIVVVDAMEDDAAHHAQAKGMVDELGKRLSTDADIKKVVWGFDPSEFSPRTVRLLPLDQLADQLAQVEKAKPMLASKSLEELVRTSIDQARKAMTPAAPAATQKQDGEPSSQEIAGTVKGIGELNQLFVAVRTVLDTPLDKPVDFEKLVAEDGTAQPWQYMTSTNGRLYFLRVSPRPRPGTLSAFEPAILAIRAAMKEVRQRYPDVEAGLTGIDVVEADETKAATWDSTWTSIVAVVLITLLLIFAFHSRRMPVLSMLALLVAIAWSFGFLTLAIGHLQVLSVVFTLILLGLGMEYGIHVSTNFETLRHEYPDTLDGFTDTLAQTLVRTGPGLLTGCLTTASGFATTLFTNFTGVGEMGLVAGMGILFCLISMFSVYPALLRLIKPFHRHVVPLLERKVHFYEDRWVNPFIRHPRMTLTVIGILTGLSLLALMRMQFDYDLLKLQPRGVDSVLWQQRIVERGQESIWFGVSVVDDLEQARTLAAAYRKQPLVSQKLGGVGLLFPPQEEQRLAMLAHARTALEPALSEAMTQQVTPASGAGLSLQMAILRQTLPAAMLQTMPDAIHQALVKLQGTLNQTAELALKLPGDQLNARLARVEAEYVKFRQSAAQRITILTDGQPLSLKDVPGELLHSYISDQGKLALEVYPLLPKDDPRIDGPLNPNFLPRFVHSLTQVDPNVTGVIVQIYKSGHLIKTAYGVAGIAAFIAVFILVWFDFRNLYDSLLTLVPPMAGFGITFGLMWLLGMQINPANIIVLPLMFGIGVDCGVLMIHRYHLEPSVRPLGLAGGTGKGITLTSYTTMIGFGVMIFASHRGIASLGLVFFLGIGMTLIACWTALPAWLELRQQRIERLAGQNSSLKEV